MLDCQWTTNPMDANSPSLLESAQATLADSLLTLNTQIKNWAKNRLGMV